MKKFKFNRIGRIKRTKKVKKSIVNEASKVPPEVIKALDEARQNTIVDTYKSYYEMSKDELIKEVVKQDFTIYKTFAYILERGIIDDYSNYCAKLLTRD